MNAGASTIRLTGLAASAHVRSILLREIVAQDEGYARRWDELCVEYGGTAGVPACVALTAWADLLLDQAFAGANELGPALHRLEAILQGFAATRAEAEIELIGVCLLEPLQKGSLADPLCSTRIRGRLGPETLRRWTALERDWQIAAPPTSLWAALHERLAAVAEMLRNMGRLFQL